ncbi:MAG: hypothetical protein SOZ34_09295 [Clostridia bacterium]|nr:hypothetical protein [Clostridia bacterium]
MRIFENTQHNVLSLEQFKLFFDTDCKLPSADSEYGKVLTADADDALTEEIPQLYAHDYRRFISDGNRTEFEDGYFKRRLLLKRLLVGEIIQNKNRYTDKIIDIIWLIMEESTWVIPAHNKKRLGFTSYENASLPECFDNQFHYIDLFAAETGADLAAAYYFLKDKFEQAVPEIINDKILYTLQQRIIIPFLRFNNMWWMGYENPKVNNWNPWIISNVLTVTALTEANTDIRKRVLDKSKKCLDFFIDGYKPDGGCDEGPAYWSRAGAALFDALEIISDMTGGDDDYFENPIIKNIMDYIRKVHIKGHTYASFADSSPRAYDEGLTFAMRMGLRTKNPQLYNFAYNLSDGYFKLRDLYSIYRNLKDICFKANMNTDEDISYMPEKMCVLPDLQIARICCDNGFTAVIKGGRNNESHNHNDVGNAIVFMGEYPVFIDMGSATYTRYVFSDKRYTIFPIPSHWHNVPEFDGIGQKEGYEFKADSFSTGENFASVQYQSAYPKDAKVSKCERSICEDDGKITIHESVSSKSHEVTFNYYLVNKPVLNDNILTLPNGITITLMTSGSIFLEEFEIPDDKVKKNWQSDNMYKLSVKYTNTSDIDFEIKIEKNKGVNAQK